MKIVTVVGARPQFIKAAVVSRHLRAIEHVEEVIVHTGQHYDESMSDIFFRELDIPKPSHFLHVGSGSHGAQTGRMLEALERVMIQVCPDKVLIYGDTNSTLAGALAAVKLHIPVAHVEAGLRSFNRKMPEEINRIMADHLSTWLFAVTNASVSNLHDEGIADSSIHLVGDVMRDAALHYGQQVDQSMLTQLNLEPKQYVLATVHRAENTDNISNLQCIFEALDAIAETIPVVLPLHPRTRMALDRANVHPSNSNLHFIAPVSYLEMVALEKHAALVVTDSGGVQKEAFFHGVTCVTLRHETEWNELVDAGWNVLAPPTSAQVIKDAILDSLKPTQHTASPENLYGAGEAGKQIVELLCA